MWLVGKTGHVNTNYSRVNASLPRALTAPVARIREVLIAHWHAPDLA